MRVVVRGLVKTFGSTVALRGVEATFEQGLTLLVGANGSGKSTLLNIIGTVLRPTSGSVRYELGAGPEETTELAEIRACVGWVSHESLAYPDLTGRQNIELAAALYGVDPASAWVRAAERFQLGAFAGRPVRTYSRGQRQRIALARALVHEPRIVLLDEPTTGLDAAGIGRLQEMVDEELARGALVAVVSHEPEVFAGRATKTVALVRGRVS